MAIVWGVPNFRIFTVYVTAITETREAPQSSGYNGSVMVQEATVKSWVQGCFAMGRMENSLCQPSSKWIPFLNQGRIRQPRREMGSTFHHLCPRYSRTLTPTAPMAIRLWETFAFIFFTTETKVQWNIRPMRMEINSYLWKNFNSTKIKEVFLIFGIPHHYSKAHKDP